MGAILDEMIAIYKARPSPFWKIEISYDHAMPKPDYPFDRHFEEREIIRFKKRFKRLYRLLFVCVVIFFIMHATVWLNEELLLVLSFGILYTKSIEHVKLAFMNYQIPRIVEELVWTTLVKRTEVIFNELRFHLLATYFTKTNVFVNTKTALKRTEVLLASSTNSLDVLKSDLFLGELKQLESSDTKYCTEILNFELNHIALTAEFFPVLAYTSDRQNTPISECITLVTILNDHMSYIYNPTIQTWTHDDSSRIGDRYFR